MTVVLRAEKCGTLTCAAGPLWWVHGEVFTVARQEHWVAPVPAGKGAQSGACYDLDALTLSAEHTVFPLLLSLYAVSHTTVALVARPSFGASYSLACRSPLLISFFFTFSRERMSFFA